MKTTQGSQFEEADGMPGLIPGLLHVSDMGLYSPMLLANRAKQILDELFIFELLIGISNPLLLFEDDISQHLCCYN